MDKSPSGRRKALDRRQRTQQVGHEMDLMIRSRRAIRWLLPGLVVKRWMLTSGLGLILALLGAAIWADLNPIYWSIIDRNVYIHNFFFIIESF